MPQNSALLTQFRKANGMTAFAKGNAFPFALTSTSQLMPVLAKCVDTINQGGLRAAGDFAAMTAASAVRQPKEVAPAATVTVLPKANTERLAASPPAPVKVESSLKTEVSQDFGIEAMELATNFILKTALQNPRILSRSEISPSLVNNAAGWKSDEAYGFVRIIAQDGDTKGIDVASAIAAADAKECKGKFASGRVAELVDSEVVFRGFAACEDTDGARSAQYFVLPRSKGGFIVFSVISDMKSEPARGVAKEEKVANFRKAALVAVADLH
jgi:hypothetical protein